MRNEDEKSWLIGRSKTLEERLWAGVDIAGDDDCWEWNGYRDGKGYGRIYYGEDRGRGRMMPVHRLSLEIKVGRILEPEYDACHTCDNRPCVNPKHLFVGTRSDNMQDCFRKKRHPTSNMSHCKWGHEFTKENTIINNLKNGRIMRRCRKCHYDLVKRRRMK